MLLVLSLLAGFCVEGRAADADSPRTGGSAHAATPQSLPSRRAAAAACAEFALAGGARARLEAGGGNDTLRIRVLPAGAPAFRDDLPSALLPGAVSGACAALQPGA